MPSNQIPVAYRAPFDFTGPCYVDQRPVGESILDIVLSIPNLPFNFLNDGYVCINGEVVPRDRWAYVRPKPPSKDFHIAVTLHHSLQNPGGGGSGSSKQIAGLVAAIALVVVVTAISGGILGPEGALSISSTFFAANSVSAAVLAGSVGLAGALAISALTRPPTSQAGIDTGTSVNADQSEAAAASGNIIDKGGSIPRVIGTRKIFPPLACEPVVELVDQDEYVEALFILNGPHAMTDVRAEGILVSDSEDIEIEMREGWSTDTDITLVTRQGRTITPQLELSDYSRSSDGVTLIHKSLPESDLPIWHGFSAKDSPDEIWMHILLPAGLTDGTATNWGVALRARFRLRGTSTWINCPEFHVKAATPQQMRLSLNFKWAAAESISGQGEDTNAGNTGIYYANINVPPQTLAPATPVDREWDANSYFNNGTGSVDYAQWSAGVINATTRIRNITMSPTQLTVWLDEGTFPKGIYEFQIKRSSNYNFTGFTPTTYVYSSYGPGVADFFWYHDATTPTSPQSHANVSDRVMVTRLISIWNEPPITRNGELAVIAIRAINRSVRQLSCIASGYVRDWDGSGWNTWTTTSNPAPHYVDILSGALNLDPLPSDLRDDAGLVAWRTLCNTNGWTCDSIVNNTRTQDVLATVAACAYARPYQSDIYGVVVDNDRSLDAPVQVFSRRNSSSLRYEKAFARVPAGFVVTYRNEASDEDSAQVTVYQRNPANADLTLLETISFDGIIDTTKVATRAQFDLDQSVLRSTFYYLDSDIESLVCRRGSLVAVEHDILFNRAGDGYIVSKQLGGSPTQITGVTLDAEIPITTVGDMHATADMHLVTNMHDIGVNTGITIRRTDGTLSTHQLSNATGNTNVLTFTTPITDVATIQGLVDNDRKYGCLVVSGAMGSIYKRLLILSITPKSDLSAQLVLVDEAPELVRI